MIRRREFITLLGGAAAAWPLVASAQRPVMPVIGTLWGASPEALANLPSAFREGLSETGFIEGYNVALEHLFAEGRNDRLPAMAADLVRRRVTLIFTPYLQAALVAKAATSTIPIVFRLGSDPVQYGFVISFNKPGSNFTGIYDFQADLGPRLGLLHDLLPGASHIAVLVDPTDASTESTIRDLRAAAATIKRSIEFVTASNNREIDVAIASLPQKRIEALLVPPGSPLFFNRRVQLVTLVTHYRLPAIYGFREFVEIGGLMSYGSVLVDQFRRAGIYAGRILKGEKPGDLPVLQPTTLELIINGQTARTLGIEVPPGLVAITDKLIE
jgi:putative ABC transport system substrate-binding protein